MDVSKEEIVRMEQGEEWREGGKEERWEWCGYGGDVESRWKRRCGGM